MEPDIAFIELTKNQQKKGKVSIRYFLLFKLFFLIKYCWYLIYSYICKRINNYLLLITKINLD